jgi:cytochrome c-type biogenesis protein CcmH/NrfG
MSAPLFCGNGPPLDFATRRGEEPGMSEDPAALEATIRADLARNPGDPAALTNMAWLLRQQGQLRDAVLHCDAAIRVAPNYALAWLERGFVLASGGSMNAARQCYEQVVALEPGNPDAHAGIASILARDGDSALGRDHAAKALAADPVNPIAAAALATMQIESGEAEAAEALLAPIAATLTEPSADRALINGQLGDARHKLGKPAEAYGCYALAKADFAAIHAPRMAGRASHCEFIERITDELSQLNSQGWEPRPPPPVAKAAERHLFLLGYPRSGNTLVENILASLPGVAVLEERPTMVDADMTFLAEPGALAQLDALSPEQLQQFRTAYWDRVGANGGQVGGHCLVDMDPLKGTRLPLIARLFPNSRVLIMRRDPRDVVWSCFHTQFALTNAALDFTTLDRAARHYAAMMTLIETALDRLPLNTHVVQYHRLVQDFDAETQAICAFASLEWTEAVRSFDRTATKRGVSTASAGQVRRGLYDGTRQWEPYAEYLAPVLPILQPWIEKFGYA